MFYECSIEEFFRITYNTNTTFSSTAFEYHYIWENIRYDNATKTFMGKVHFIYTTKKGSSLAAPSSNGWFTNILSIFSKRNSSASPTLINLRPKSINYFGRSKK